MKKFFFLALALAICAFTFVSCDKEKDKDNNSESVYAQSIIGTWHLDRAWDGEDQMWYEGEDIEDVDYVFDKKGTFYWDYKDGEIYPLKYHIEKDVIYIGDEEEDGSNWKDWEATYRISSISSNKMVLLFVDDDSGSKMEFKKIK